MKIRLSEIYDRIEEVYDAIHFKVGCRLDILSELVSDAWRLMTERIGKTVGTGILHLVRVIAPGSGGTARGGRIASASRGVVGLTLVLGVGLAGLVALGVVGIVGNLFGLRKGREYSLAENFASWAPLIIVALALPSFGMNDFKLGQLILFFSYSIIILGLNILCGIAGQISLGHASFVLIGGYAAVLAFQGAVFGVVVPPVLAILLGGGCAALVGLAVGLPAARLKGPYLALLTLGLMISTSPLLKSKFLRGVIGGDDLAFEPPHPPVALHFLTPARWMYYLALGTFVAMFYCAHVLVNRTKVGRAFAAIQDGEEKSNVLGINMPLYKILAFVLSAFYAGVGGAVLMLQSGYVSPDSQTMKDSLDYVVALVIGGIGGFFGSVVGGAFLAYQGFFSSWLARWVVHGDQLLWAVYGIMVVIVVIVAPRGITGEISHWLYSRRFILPARRRHRREPFPDYELEEEFLATRLASWKAQESLEQGSEDVGSVPGTASSMLERTDP